MSLGYEGEVGQAMNEATSQYDRWLNTCNRGNTNQLNASIGA